MKKLLVAVCALISFLAVSKQSLAAPISFSYYSEGTLAVGFLPADIVEIECRILGQSYNPFMKPDFALTANWLLNSSGPGRIAVGTGYDFRHNCFMLPVRMTATPFSNLQGLEVGFEFLSRISGNYQMVPQGCIRIRF